MNERKWDIIYVLPNISLQQTFETSCVALVPFQDERVRQIEATSAECSKVLNSFFDHSKRKVEPSVLLIAKDASPTVMSEEALVSFRNAVSMAIIIKSWASVVPKGNVMSPLFSDFFDFYPIAIGHQGFVTSTPAVNALYSTDSPFIGTVSPYLPRLLTIKHDVDDIILKAMLKVWEHRFVQPATDTRFSRVLFRSLEMAYHATSTPIKNESSLFDYGVNLALWVSAFEILAHPGKGRVDLGKVISQLSNFQWKHKSLTMRRYRVMTYRKKGKIIRENGNFSQVVYKNLYDARNSFLHGNAVNNKVLHVRGDKKSLPLYAVIPIIYRTALHVFLDRYIKKCERQCTKICMPPTKKICRFDYGLFIAERQYEDCLLRALGLDSNIT